jgi:hypothetical protein
MKLTASLLQRALLVLTCSIASALPSAGQGVGGISGTVMDSSGGALPGAAVILASDQGTVGGSQEVVADARGAYQFLRLVPGSYSVRASLPAFQSTQQLNIVVVSDQTARADLRLAVGTLEETITVSGGVALLDTTNALKQTVITREDLANLPNRSDIWSMARIVPGIVMQNMDVGGTDRFFQGIATARGRNSENKSLIDGTDVSSMGVRGTTNMMYLDPYAFEQTNIVVGAGSAEFLAGGVTYNVVTRSGTNQFHGGMNFNGTTPRLARSNNLSAEQRQQLLRNVPPLALQQNPAISVSADIRKDVDIGGWLAGPILRDRLWFAGTWRDQRLDQYALGQFNPDGTQVLDDNIMWTTSAKISWQVSRRGAQLSYFNNTQYKLLGHRSATIGSPFFDSNATEYNFKYPMVNQIKFTSPIRSNMAIDVVFSRFSANDTYHPQPGIMAGTVAIQDTTRQFVGAAAPLYNVARMFRNNVKANLSWYLGSHDLKMGVEQQYNGRQVKNWSLSGMRANFANGVPTSVTTYLLPVAADGEGSDIPWLYQPKENVSSAFIQDRWVLHSRLTVNTGVRFDAQSTSLGETCRPETMFASGQCYPAVENAPSFRDFAPRFNLVYDLFGDGRTALKFAANRYNQPVGVQIIERLNPTATVTNQRQWLSQGRCNDAGVTGCDRNGDRIPQLSELGVSPGYVFAGVNAFYPDDLEREVSNEYSVEFQRQLPQEVVFSAHVVRSETRRNIASTNSAAPPSTWNGPFTVTEVVSGEQVAVWARGTTASANMFYNDPALDLTYHGLDLSLNKRMSNRWSMTGGANFGRARVKSRGGNRNDPNVFMSPFDTGVPFGDRPWSYRMSGAYQLPHELLVSATAQYMIGAPETTTVTVTNQTIALPQGNQSVVVRPVGSVRLPNIASLDMSIRKRFGFPSFGTRSAVSMRLDIFNLTNEATISEWVSVLGPNYHLPNAVQRGRLVRAEVAYDF